MKPNEKITETNNRKQNDRKPPASRRPSAFLTAPALALLGAACVFLVSCGGSAADTASKSALESAASSEAPQTDSASAVLPDATANGGFSEDTLSASGAAGMSVSGVGGLRNTVTVNSSEKVTVVPDIAQVVYAVRTEAKNAADCRTGNEEDTGKVIELLKSLGVAGTSIQTSDYSMYPIYNYSGNTQKVTGYEATSTLTVSDLPIDSLGNLLTKSVQAGINNITSITYQSSHYDESYQKALQLAVTAAHEKAAALAQAAGCSLGKAVSIVENSGYSEARYNDRALAAKASALEASLEDMAGSGTNIMPGEVDVEVNITVEYLLP